MNFVGKGAPGTVSYCIINKQMASDSSPLPYVNQKFSNIWVGSRSVDIGVVYVNNWQR